MNTHCSNALPAQPADLRTPSPSAEHLPVFSFACALEGRLLPCGASVSPIETAHYDAFGNRLDG